MLSERRVLEAELEKIRTGTVRRSPGLEPRRLSMSQYLDRNVYDSFTEQTPESSTCEYRRVDKQSFSSSSASRQSESTQLKTHSPLDRRALEHSENLQILAVQVESAKEQLEKKRKALEEFPDGHKRRGKVCGRCHKSGHNKAKC